jgi:glycerol dehydrogenase
VRTTLAPAALLRGEGALETVGEEVARLGARALLVHGEHGIASVESALQASLAEAGVTSAATPHLGLVTSSAVDQLVNTVRTGRHDLVLGVGGGRVLDAAKAAAHGADVPYVAVPTSPATCAATTALSVLYDEGGVWQGPAFVPACPALVVLDPAVLATAPDRLLAAGVLDAWCKVEEVRLAAPAVVAPDAMLETALATCDVLARSVDPATGALANGLPVDPTERATLAETVIVLPGLIAGLAGEGNKLAAAHAVHNAFTLLSDHQGSLHGELVAFGVLVQAALHGADDATLSARIRWIETLNVTPTLSALGCRAYHDDPRPVLAWMMAAPALRRAFPSVTESHLHDVISRIDGLATTLPD